MAGVQSHARLNGSCTIHALFTQEDPGKFDLIKTGGVQKNDLTSSRGSAQTGLLKTNVPLPQVVSLARAWIGYRLVLIVPGTQ